MKEKRRVRFPVLLKVILLGIITSFIASTVAVIVSYNRITSKALEELNASANEALENADKYFTQSEAGSIKNMESFVYVEDYVIENYTYYSKVRDAELSDYPTFKEFEDLYRNNFPYFYADGMFMTLDYPVFYQNYVAINQILLNASFYSGLATYYAIKDPNNPNRFIFICDSRLGTLKERGIFYHCPGTHYDIKSSDYIFDIGHECIKGYQLDNFTTRFVEMEIDTDGDSDTPPLIAYMFVEYETASVIRSYNSVLINEIIILIATSIAVILLYAILSYFLFVKNINKLNNAALDISNQLQSNKPFNVINPNIRSHDEMSSLGESFVVMENHLLNYVDIIKADAKEKEKINAELDIASKIQREALPKSKFDDGRVSIRAFMKAAKEVGGDFYDYFYINDNELAVIISDVSGKGIPASLFMMKSKELIKSKLLSGVELAQAVKEANDILNTNNEESLFVTSFIGIINLEKEIMKYVNAGHEKPYIISGNKVSKLNCSANFVLGGLDNIEYKEENVKFHKDDIIFMFTDGLNESINNNEEEFSYKRIEECLNASMGSSLDDYINNMKNALAEFVGRKEAFDDITMIVTRLSSNSLSLSFDKKDPSIIEEAINRFEESFSFIEQERKSKVGIILDELLNNLISYEEREDLHIDVNFSIKGEDLLIEIIANGHDYDPFKNHKEKYLDNFSHSIEEGGFGVKIVKELSKEAKYSYKDSHSVITIRI